MTSRSRPFSSDLESWLLSKREKTVGSMLTVLDEKSFAFLFLVLLLLPALPLPTGGLSHAFEVVAIIIAMQLVVGRHELWLPARLASKKIPHSLTQRMVPLVISRIKWLEKYSRNRGARVISAQWFRMQLGVAVTMLSMVAFLAPPFSFLDTLPSLGVVLISLGVILEDIYIVLAGYVVGALGAVLVGLLGAGVLGVLSHLF